MIYNHKLIISGNNYVSLYDQGKEVVLHSEGGVYYGISWSKDRLFVLWRNFKQGEIILVFDTTFQLIDQIALHRYLDGHQILWINDKLYVTNTAENALLEINLPDRRIRDIRLTPYDHDHNHINGLSYIDERYLWILYANGKIDKDSEINRFDTHRQQIVESFSIGRQIHNYMSGFITSSRDFKVMRNNGSQITTSAALEGWIRGMDFVENNMVVGSSVISEREDRGNRHDGKLYVLDQGLNVLDELKVPAIGQINDIRTISKDHSHNGIIFGAC